MATQPKQAHTCPPPELTPPRSDYDRVKDIVRRSEDPCDTLYCVFDLPDLVALRGLLQHVDWLSGEMNGARQERQDANRLLAMVTAQRDDFERLASAYSELCERLAKKAGL